MDDLFEFRYTQFLNISCVKSAINVDMTLGKI